MQSGTAGFFSSGQQGMSAIASTSGDWSAMSIVMPVIEPHEAMAAAAAVTLAGPIRTASMANAQRMRWMTMTGFMISFLHDRQAVVKTPERRAPSGRDSDLGTRPSATVATRLGTMPGG